MNKNIISKTTRVSSIVLSIFVVLNGFATLTSGFLLLLIVSLGETGILPDMPPDVIASIQNKNHELFLLGLLFTTYLILCILSLVLWVRGKRTWGFVLITLVLIHSIGLNQLFSYYFMPIHPVFLFLSVIILDLPVVVIIFYDLFRQKNFFSRKGV
jgi:hypothetical protein